MRSEDLSPSTVRAAAWLGEQIGAFEALRGHRVTKWQGSEWALRFDDESDEPAQFDDPEVPCVQAIELIAVVEGQDPVCFWAPQDDEGFGLGIERRHWTRRHSGGALRSRESLPLPTGIVERVEVRVEHSCISEVAMQVGGVDILLVAGEVGDAWGELLQWHRFDEQVLAFPNASDADQIDWVPPRPPGPA
ncbi:hypothetical protein [Frondihabitans sp. PAMC 28766]|uniref:hypothetical protein n=1 Tax=Frondihabitans sp. PAMC 28766 TaxID=1795630 RepID=UPI0012FF99CB|nr:hypothetical protein [Frondihabitans sp. PAMC 28766]